ncbi:hypothetical protein [Flavobacterium sp.]|uniref:hypothetical protein n=1 Tax=Flavobacterium sp. TaxID=239 RepID=UPI00262BC1D1|nr:hypothetical protein [Flavobacterium sp.]
MLKLRKLLFGGGIATTLLLVFVLQFVHAVNHLVHEFEVKDCNHQYTLGKTEVGHAHYTFEKCFQCAFAFSSYIEPIAISFHSQHSNTTSTYEIQAPHRFVTIFEGSFFSLRAPPIVG